MRFLDLFSVVSLLEETATHVNAQMHDLTYLNAHSVHLQHEPLTADGDGDGVPSVAANNMARCVASGW